jgi:hypothetical protein
MSDLIERLLAGTGGGKHWMELHEEAATRIKELESRLEMSEHVTEIMPSDMPQWMWDAIDKGLLARRSMEKVAKLEARVDWLECLEAAGVDNWAGIDVARDMLDDSL